MTEEVRNSREIQPEEQDRIRERIIDLDEPKLKFYESLRQRAKTWSSTKGGVIGDKLGEYLFILPDLFILICRLAVDKRVPAKKKVFIGGIIAYMMMPLDIIPDFIPIIGMVDDLVLAVYGLNMLLNDIDKKILMDNWSGEGDILELLQKISATAENFLDKNVLSRIKNWFKK